MSRRISAELWVARAAALNLEWVEGAPYRNDTPTAIKCLICGNRWNARPAHIAKGGGCPVCQKANSRISASDWAKRIQTVNATWVGDPPKTLADKRAVAECGLCGVQWAVDPRSLYIGRGHPRCKGRVKLAAIEAKTWDLRAANSGIKWLETPLTSKSKTPAECLSCGHKWSPVPSNILGGSGCPQCAKSKVSKFQKVSEAEWHNRAKKANIRWVDGAPKNARLKHPAQCTECDYVWEVNPSNISKGTGCPACAKNASLPQSVWDARAQAVGLIWLAPVTGRHNKSLAKCITCNKTWMAEAGQVASGAGCPDCGAKKAAISRRLSPEHWLELAKMSNLEWLEIPENNSIKKKIECLTCGHSWRVIPATISGGSGCPQCSGTFVSEQTWHARAAAVGIKWLVAPTDARVPTSAQCLACGLQWQPVPDGVRLGSGCPDCAVTGYKVGQAGLLYLVERSNNKGRPARKIGISNVSSSQVRLALWRRQGFVLVHKITHPTGQLIYDLEQSTLKWLRQELELPQYLDREEMPLGGATETFQPDQPSNNEVVRKLEFEFNRLKRLRNQD